MSIEIGLLGPEVWHDAILGESVWEGLMECQMNGTPPVTAIVAPDT
jgi:hypothetical protein